MRVSGGGAVPFTEVTATLNITIINSESVATREQPVTITAKADANGNWEFATDCGGQWPPPAGRCGELINQAQATAMFGGTPTTSPDLVTPSWSIVYCGANGEQLGGTVVVTGASGTAAVFTGLPSAGGDITAPHST